MQLDKETTHLKNLKHRRKRVVVDLVNLHQPQNLLLLKQRQKLRQLKNLHLNKEEEVREAVLQEDQEVVVKEDLNQVDQKVLQEVKNPQEVLRVVQVVGQGEEPLREEQKQIGVDQGEGAILGVNLISQFLQIRI